MCQENLLVFFKTDENNLFWQNHHDDHLQLSQNVLFENHFNGFKRLCPGKRNNRAHSMLNWFSIVPKAASLVFTPYQHLPYLPKTPPEPPQRFQFQTIFTFLLICHFTTFFLRVTGVSKLIHFYATLELWVKRN